MRTLWLSALLLAGPGMARCGWDGAAYVPRGGYAPEGYRYRLVTTQLPPDADGSAIAEQWRFTVSDGRGYRLSDITLLRSCAMGRGPCAVSPIGDTTTEGPFYSVITELNADLSPVRTRATPYAIVFANFSEHDWQFALTRHVRGVRYFTRTHVPPSLEGQTVWVRTKCGRD